MAHSPSTPGQLLADIQHRFMFHPADTPERVAAHEATREQFRELALAMGEQLPPGRELSLCLTSLEEGLFWANAAIARQR